MGEFMIMVIIAVILGIGFIAGDDLANRRFEDVLGTPAESIKVMKVDCEASLPRDKFCKLEIKAVEDK